MRIKYTDPKLEIIDLLDADIVTASTGTGDNDFPFPFSLRNTVQSILNDDWNESDWTSGNSSWTK